MSYAYLRGGPVVDASQAVIVLALAFLNLGGLGLIAYSLTLSLNRVSVLANGSIMIKQRYPFTSSAKNIESTELSPAQVVESKSDEGMPYFYARVCQKDGTEIDLIESYNRELCKSACDEFNQAVWPDRE